MEQPVGSVELHGNEQSANMPPPMLTSFHVSPAHALHHRAQPQPSPAGATQEVHHGSPGSTAAPAGPSHVRHSHASTAHHSHHAAVGGTAHADTAQPEQPATTPAPEEVAEHDQNHPHEGDRRVPDPVALAPSGGEAIAARLLALPEREGAADLSGHDKEMEAMLGVVKVNGRVRRTSTVMLTEEAARTQAVVGIGFETDVLGAHVEMMRVLEQGRRDEAHHALQARMEMDSRVRTDRWAAAAEELSMQVTAALTIQKFYRRWRAAHPRDPNAPPQERDWRHYAGKKKGRGKSGAKSARREGFGASASKNAASSPAPGAAAKMSPAEQWLARQEAQALASAQPDAGAGAATEPSKARAVSVVPPASPVPGAGPTSGKGAAVRSAASTPVPTQAKTAAAAAASHAKAGPRGPSPMLKKPAAGASAASTSVRARATPSPAPPRKPSSHGTGAPRPSHNAHPTGSNRAAPSPSPAPAKAGGASVLGKTSSTVSVQAPAAHVLRTAPNKGSAAGGARSSQQVQPEAGTAAADPSPSSVTAAVPAPAHSSQCGPAADTRASGSGAAAAGGLPVRTVAGADDTEAADPLMAGLVLVGDASEHSAAPLSAAGSEALPVASPHPQWTAAAPPTSSAHLTKLPSSAARAASGEAGAVASPVPRVAPGPSISKRAGPSPKPSIQARRSLDSNASTRTPGSSSSTSGSVHHRGLRPAGSTSLCSISSLGQPGSADGRQQLPQVAPHPPSDPAPASKPHHHHTSSSGSGKGGSEPTSERSGGSSSGDAHARPRGSGAAAARALPGVRAHPSGVPAAGTRRGSIDLGILAKATSNVASSASPADPTSLVSPESGQSSAEPLAALSSSWNELSGPSPAVGGSVKGGVRRSFEGHKHGRALLAASVAPLGKQPASSDAAVVHLPKIV